MASIKNSQSSTAVQARSVDSDKRHAAAITTCIGGLNLISEACARIWSAATHLNKGVVNTSSIGQEEAAARRQAVKEEELLLSAQDAVVPLLGLLHAVLVVLHAVLVWEGDTVHTLSHHQKQRKNFLHRVCVRVCVYKPRHDAKT